MLKNAYCITNLKRVIEIILFTHRPKIKSLLTAASVDSFWSCDCWPPRAWSIGRRDVLELVLSYIWRSLWRCNDIAYLPLGASWVLQEEAQRGRIYARNKQCDRQSSVCFVMSFCCEPSTTRVIIVHWFYFIFCPRCSEANPEEASSHFSRV